MSCQVHLIKFHLNAVKACEDPYVFFADCLDEAFDELLTDDLCVIRIFVARCEVRNRE